MSDAKTGMPQLPKGQFWRISHYMGFTHWRDENGVVVFPEFKISLYKKTWFRPKEIDYALSPTDTLSIRKAAERVLHVVEERAKINSMVGDYPPKRLN